MSQKDRDMLLNYGWPGNVRELENCALYYMTLGKLPEQFQNKELMGTGETDEDIQSKISGEILEILFKKNSIGHGTGRMCYPHMSKQQGSLNVSVCFCSAMESRYRFTQIIVLLQFILLSALRQGLSWPPS